MSRNTFTPLRTSGVRLLTGICLLVFAGFLSVPDLYAQQITVTGHVTDRQNEPIIGASISIKGKTAAGAISDLDGNFTLSAPTNSTLIISYLGYKTVETAAVAGKTLAIVLDENLEALEEVVVIGYGVSKKKDITTAVSTVSNEDINERPILSAAQAIQGKAAGVQVVQPSGKPGASLSMRIRGATSISGSSEPVYVVDGVMMTDIQNLNPTDIESMQILKDASSAAIYGSRAANGVVLITTKKGASGEAKVEFNAYGGFSHVGKTFQPLNTSQYRELMTEIMGPGSVPNDINTSTNWNKEIFKTGSQQNYQLAVSGGNERINYYVSGGYQREKGIISPADYQRFSFRGNLNVQLKKWLKMQTGFSYARYTRRDAADNAGSSRGGILLSVINTPPFLSVWDENNPGQYASNPYNAGWDNPVAASDKFKQHKDSRITANIAFDADLYKGLKFRTSFSIDANSYMYDDFTDPIKTSYGRSKNGLGSATRGNSIVWLNENLLTYDQNWGKHNFSALGGFTVQGYQYEQTGLGGEDFVKGVNNNLDFMTLGWANKITSGYTSLTEWALVSGLARVHYNYDSRYLVTVNFRADGSSKLHPDHRWGYFPSGSVGWRISGEDFFEPARDVVDDLKLRVGWGITGSQEGIGNYEYFGRYGTSRVESSGNELTGPSIYRSSFSNKDLTWEKTMQTNVGIDLSLFNSRIQLAIDGYYKRTSDLLLNIPLPSSVGVGNVLRNDGVITNKGLEIELNTHNLTGKFKWDTQFNISFNRNKIEKLSLTKTYYEGYIESVGQNVIIIKEGVSLGTFYGYKSLGVDPETGDIRYEDRNRNGYLDPEDRDVIGCAQPKFTAGMTNTLSYKGFSLSFLLQGSYGNDVFNASRIDTEGMFDSKNQTVTVLDRWKRPGMITDVPRAGNVQNAYVSSRFVEDGSYLRMKTATLSYSFDKSLLSRIKLSNLTIFATINNLFTITGYSGYDPEVNYGGNSNTLLGVDYGTYPQSRSYIFGLNLQF